MIRPLCPLGLALVFFSCATNAGTGMMAGATVGAGSGALVDPGPGGWIGGAVGAITGGLIGYAIDAQDRRAIEKSSPKTIDRMDRNEPLTIADIIRLSRQKVSDQAIIDYLYEVKAVYYLTQLQIRQLQANQVGKAVIAYMIQTGMQ